MGGSTRFYYLPWCKERKVAELRYVARYSSNLTKFGSKLADMVFDYFYLVKSEPKNVPREWLDFTEDNQKCFNNAMLMRLDPGNYMVQDRFSDSKCDLNLFSINRNPPSDVVRYFSQYWTDTSLVSYFSEDYLDSGEFKFEEIKVLEPSLHTVILPRALIESEIPGLYLVVPFDERWHFDGILNSESYKIMAAMEHLNSTATRWEYEQAKSRGARDLGESFVRFPNVWSAMDSLMTPSGHMLRMTSRVREHVSFLREDSRECVKV